MASPSDWTLLNKTLLDRTIDNKKTIIMIIREKSKKLTNRLFQSSAYYKSRIAEEQHWWEKFGPPIVITEEERLKIFALVSQYQHFLHTEEANLLEVLYGSGSIILPQDKVMLVTIDIEQECLTMVARKMIEDSDQWGSPIDAFGN